MAIMWIGRDFLVLIGLSLACIFAGMFGYSCEIVGDLDGGGLCVLAVLFFPVTMIIGIGVAFR